MRVGVGAGRGRQGMCSGMRWWSVEWQSVREQQCGACVILCMQLHANIDLGGQQQCPAHFLGCCGRYPGGGEQLGSHFSKCAQADSRAQGKRLPKRDIVDTIFHALRETRQISAVESALPTS